VKSRNGKERKWKLGSSLAKCTIYCGRGLRRTGLKTGRNAQVIVFGLVVCFFPIFLFFFNLYSPLLTFIDLYWQRFRKGIWRGFRPFFRRAYLAGFDRSAAISEHIYVSHGRYLTIGSNFCQGRIERNAE
jgi:hypothetical protein